jgi:predicted kinase
MACDTFKRTQVVTILQGIPASGKSTWAKKEAFKSPKTIVIVNRDSIRDSLGKYWVPERESLVTKIENAYIISAIDSGYDVIIDATNFNPTFLRNLIKLIQNRRDFLNINLDINIKRFDISLNKAIWRDNMRGLKGGRKVGKKVIKSFYDRYISNT